MKQKDTVSWKVETKAALKAAFLHKETPSKRIRMMLHARILDRPSQTKQLLSFDLNRAGNQ
ncbi:MAG TPA: hypothetical protein VN949_01670 [Candidatus Limnocylindrales bacterium]|nr:hypothetical protein [Candidatus Limnocylindrales bacterium]